MLPLVLWLQVPPNTSMAEAAAAKFEEQVSWGCWIVRLDLERRSRGQRKSLVGASRAGAPSTPTRPATCSLSHAAGAKAHSRCCAKSCHPHLCCPPPSPTPALPSSHQVAEIEAEHVALAKRKGKKAAAAQQQQQDGAANGSTEAAAEETQQEGAAAAEQQQQEGEGKASEAGEAKEKPQVGLGQEV